MSAFPLKPCPFCGGEARLFSASLPMLADCADIQVSCEQCDAIGPGILFDQTEHGESDIPELEREAREAWNARAALSPNMDHAVGGVRDWQPRIGEQVEVTEDVDDWRAWRESTLFVAGVQAHRMGLPGLEITVSEDWPRTSHSNGLTDDFWISRPFKPDMLKPVHRRESTPPVNQDAVREALKAADWKDGLAEAYRVLLDARRSLLEEKERNSHLRGVYEPVICALEPALAEVGELYRERQAALATPPLDNTGLDAATVERPDGAIENLTNFQQQADMHGEFVKVSRQALDETLAYVAALASGDRS